MDWHALKLAAILISTWSVVGIYAAMLTRAPLAWYVRSGMVVACLAPLLTAQAAEAFVALLIQIVVVMVSCANVANRRMARNAGGETAEAGNLSVARRRWRISLGVLLQAVGVIAVILGVTRDLPSTPLTWQSVILMGVGSGATVVLSWWSVTHRCSSPLRWLIALAGTMLVATLLAYGDFFVLAILDILSWPPDGDSPIETSLAADFRPVQLWWVILGGVHSITALWFSLLAVLSQRPFIPGDAAPATNRVRRFAFFSLVTIALVLSAMPLSVLVWLHTSFPIPPESSEFQANYRELVAVGEKLEASSYGPAVADWNAIPVSQLQGARTGILSDLEQVRELLGKTGEVPVDYQTSTALESIAGISNLRTLARAFALEGRGHLEAGLPDQACQSYLDCIRLGYFARSQGLVLDAFIGSALTRIGISELYQHHQKFSATASRDAARRLLELTSLSSEQIEGALARERAWAWNTGGWTSRLRLFVNDEYSGAADLRSTIRTEAMLHRLLATHLALQAYRLDQGRLPQSLSALVPAYLSSVPIDPFDSNGGPLSYHWLEDDFQLYSLAAPEQVMGESSVRGASSQANRVSLRTYFGR